MADALRAGSSGATNGPLAAGLRDARGRDRGRRRGRRQQRHAVGVEQRVGVGPAGRTHNPGLVVMELDYTFHAMGSDVRRLIGSRLRRSACSSLDAADREKAFVLEFGRRLSRFVADSELSALNRDPRSTVPASALLRAAVRAGLWAAERSGGLVEPTLVGALERVGYSASRDGVVPASLREALDGAPERRPARRDPRSRWGEIVVDDEAGTIVRPAGVMLDTGGTGKGLCADAVACRLSD